jgi:hypothetical protein
MAFRFIKFIIIAFISGFISCGNSDTENIGSIDTGLSASTGFSKERTRYKLPSPVELYVQLKLATPESVIDKLNKPSYAGNYLTESSRAINFGIYASDLAYCTVYGHLQETHEYFRVLKIMAENLGINDGYDEAVLNRINTNLNNTDSLYSISSDSYWEVCNFLENSGKANILALILMGGWVESVYLATNKVVEFHPESDIIVRITEQSFLLDNLLDYLNSLANTRQTADYLQQLNDLKYSFDKLFENPDDVLITEAQFEDISAKLAILRNNLTKW